VVHHSNFDELIPPNYNSWRKWRDENAREAILCRFDGGRRGATVNERSRPGGCRKLDGKQEAFLVALACSNPPEGRTCWTMQLLAEKLVELGVVEAISDETVRRVLKKTKQSLG